MNCPGECTDDIIRVLVRDLLHPLDANAVAAKASLCHVDHLWCRINSVAVDTGGDRGLEKDTGTTTDVQQATVRRCDPQRLTDHESVIVLVVTGWRMEVVPV